MGPVYSLPAVMSQFMSLGFILEQLITMTTVNPARVLKLESEIGTLKPGSQADISILRIIDGSWSFVDCEGNSLQTQSIILPVTTVKQGTEIAAQPTYG